MSRRVGGRGRRVVHVDRLQRYDGSGQDGNISTSRLLLYGNTLIGRPQLTATFRQAGAAGRQHFRGQTTAGRQQFDRPAAAERQHFDKQAAACKSTAKFLLSRRRRLHVRVSEKSAATGRPKRSRCKPWRLRE